MTCQSSSVPITADVGEPGRRADMPPGNPVLTRAVPGQPGNRGPPVDQRGAPAVTIQGRQREHGHQDRQRTQDHRDLLRGRGRRDEPGVDVDAGRQPGLCGDLQVGENPADLRLLLRGKGPGGAGYADEVRTRTAGVGPGVQHACRRRRRRLSVAPPQPPNRGRRRRSCPCCRGRRGHFCRHPRHWLAGSRPPIRPRPARWRSPSRGWRCPAPAELRTPAGR